MRAVVAIADAGSLTAAARQLGASLPAVVRVLAALENELGTRLFNRTTRRISATEAGRRYLERCREVLTLLDEAEAELQSEQTEPRGKLNVTAPVLFGERHVASAITAFVQRYPQVSVDLLLLDRAVNLVEEGIDVGIRIGELEDSSLIARPVATMRRVTVAAPSYLAHRGVPRQPQDLLGHNCIRYLRGGVIEWAYRVGNKTITLPVHGNFSVNHSAAAAQACTAGLGVATFFAYQVAPLVRSGALLVVLPEFETPPRPVHIIYPAARLLPARTRIFIEAMQRHIQAEAARWQVESRPLPSSPSPEAARSLAGPQRRTAKKRASRRARVGS